MTNLESKIKILLVDDHRMIREGLRALIEKQEEMLVVADVENGRTAIQIARKLRPDVVIMDINMPDLNGIEATKQVIHECPGTKVVALSVNSDKRSIISMFKSGVSGYLLKDCAFEELFLAIRSVMANQIYLSPKIAGIIVTDLVNYITVNETSDVSKLSPREREILQLIAEGRKTKDIAEHLHISVKTVETHRMQIMKKLDMYSIAELTKYALREGLTSF